MSENGSSPMEGVLPDADPILRELLDFLSSEFERQLVLRYLTTPCQESLEQFLDDYRRALPEPEQEL